MVRTSIGEFIAALRKAKGLTQMDVANHLGVSNKTVSSWETGASCPDIALLPAIAELYGVTCDELLRGERIPLQEDEKVKETKREKVLAFQLARHKNTLFLATLIGYALASLGPILTFIISFGAARPPLGFFIGLLPLLAAVFMIFLFCYNASFWCTSTQEELEAEALKDFQRAIFRARGRVCIACATAFGFIFFHLIYWSDNLAGLFPLSLLVGSIIAASAFLLSLTIYLFLKAYSPLFPQDMRRTLRYRLWTAVCTFGIVLVAWALLFFICLTNNLGNSPILNVLTFEGLIIWVPLIALAAMAIVYLLLQIWYTYYRKNHQ